MSQCELFCTSIRRGTRGLRLVRLVVRGVKVAGGIGVAGGVKVAGAVKVAGGVKVVCGRGCLHYMVRTT